MESSLRVAAERFASDFDAEFSRLANSFQIRDGFPADAMPVLERYQSWLEAAPYPRLVAMIYLLKLAPDAAPEFNRVDIQSGELVAHSTTAGIAKRTGSIPPWQRVAAFGRFDDGGHDDFPSWPAVRRPEG